MEMIQVESSNIDKIGHEGTRMRVQFKNGSIYEYQNVPAAIFEKIKTAPSVGSEFNKLVKTQPQMYPFQKVG